MSGTSYIPNFNKRVWMWLAGCDGLASNPFKSVEKLAGFFNDPHFYDVVGLPRPDPNLHYVTRHWGDAPSDIQDKIAEQERDRLEYKLGHVPPKPAGLQLPRLSLEQTAASLRDQLTGDDLVEKKAALRQIIERILVIRDDSEIRALIEYHLPETNIPPQGGGDISNSDCGPEGKPSLLLILPLKRKYILKSNK
jgi:FAD/FMN-containing dehydrogenase